MILMAVPAAFLLDTLFGDPTWLPHPVVYMGKAISRLEKFLRARLPKTPQGELLGGAVLAFCLPVGTLLLTGLVCWGAAMLHPLLGLAVAGILLTLPFAVRPLRFLMGNRVMGWLAAVSMNYYLLHQNLAVHLKRLGVPPSVSAEPNRAGEQPWQLQYTLLCFGLSLLGAALITLLIEKPCAKVLKKMFARGKAENKA